MNYASARPSIVWIVLTIIVGGLIGFFVAQSHKGTCTKPLTASCFELALNKAMRKLWADHVVWTRLYIIDAIANAGSKDATLKRLLQNQTDIANAIVPYYGQEAANALEALLKDHIVIAGDVVAAAIANDQEALKVADKKWHDNALEIATFLHNANPESWPLQTIIDMLNEHLALTTKETVAHLKGQWNEDITIFDQVFNQIMTMADALAEGIYMQFPSKK
ncbi:MAG TPA: hypothetical protein VGW78_04055 [Candidatus Babeliales bacterium]|nr:hypothetical protein [Candidatus Babeliales bacterium]